MKEPVLQDAQLHRRYRRSQITVQLPFSGTEWRLSVCCSADLCESRWQRLCAEKKTPPTHTHSSVAVGLVSCVQQQQQLAERAQCVFLRDCWMNVHTAGTHFLSEVTVNIHSITDWPEVSASSSSSAWTADSAPQQSHYHAACCRTHSFHTVSLQV